MNSQYLTLDDLKKSLQEKGFSLGYLSQCTEAEFYRLLSKQVGQDMEGQ